MGFVVVTYKVIQETPELEQRSEDAEKREPNELQKGSPSGFFRIISVLGLKGKLDTKLPEEQMDQK